MKTHLTEHQLIDFQFELCTDSEKATITEHLKTCEECRRVAEQIKQKFGQLDLVKEEVPANEQLITDTLCRVRTAEPTKIIYWPRLLGIFGTAAAAALFVVIVAPKMFPMAEKPMTIAAVPEPAAEIEENGAGVVATGLRPVEKNADGIHHPQGGDKMPSLQKSETESASKTELAMAEQNEPTTRGLFAGRMMARKAAAAPMNSIAAVDRADGDSEGARFRSEGTASGMLHPKPAAPGKPIHVIMPPDGKKLVSSVYAIESVLKDGAHIIIISNRMPTELTFAITNGTEYVVTIPAHSATNVILKTGE